MDVNIKNEILDFITALRIDINEQEPVYGESVLLLFQNGDVVVGYKADRRYYPAYGAFRKEWREIRYWCRIPDYSHLILGFPGR